MHFTRGNGLLENYLSARRAFKADRLISRELRQGSILDIGCGAYPFFLMNTEFKDKNGIDPEASLLVKNPAINLLRLSVEKCTRLPFGNQSLSVVTSLGTLEHFDQGTIQNLLAEAHRVLRPEGRLIVTSPHPLAYNILKGLAAVNMISAQEIEHARHIRDQHELVTLLIKAGFRKQCISFGQFEFGLNRWFCVRKAV